MEKIQRKFLKFAGLILKIPHPEHDYTPIANQINLSSLVDR